MINWIQNWYNEQCDGNWEHDHVIKIESLDNPGWNVEIDFNYTDTKMDDSAWNLYEISESNWIGYSIKDNVFSSSGDPSKLDLILNIFKEIVQKNNLIDEFINSNIY